MSDPIASEAESTGKRRRGSVFTIPPGEPFLTVLARAMLDGELPDSGGIAPSAIDLSFATLLMPTRRAQRALSNAFLEESGQRAMLLPSIRPISERDEELSLIAEFAAQDTVSGMGTGGEVARSKTLLSLLPAIDPMQRVLLLTRLVMQWSSAMVGAAAQAEETSAQAAVISAGARTPAQAVHMAQELAQLIDLVEAEGLSLDGLGDLVPVELTHHWELTLDFLKIITHYWPAQLEELQLLSPWKRQNSLILGEAERITGSKPDGPLIVAGVTGSIPATVELMAAVLSHENGAVVLPGLDLELDEKSWDEIVPAHPEHPQFGLKKLLDALELTRAEVGVLCGKESLAESGTGSAIDARVKFISEAMRPAATTQLWHSFALDADKAQIASGLSDVGLIEAPGAFEEAEVIALIMRETVETPGKTAALVSPDRMLSRRVAIRLKAWGIDVDDSAGRPFVKTVPGAFLDLVIDCVAREFAPAQLMALLKHPLCRVGLEAREIRFGARALEIAAFRTTYIGRGLDGVKAALANALSEREALTRRGRAFTRLRDEDWERARDLVERLVVAFSPLSELFCQRGTTFALCKLASAHLQVGEALCATQDKKSTEAESSGDPGPLQSEDELGSPLYLREAGAFAATSFASLLCETDLNPDIVALDYPDFYRSLIGRQNVRERSRVHPRLSIWGPIEARLMHADVMILGSLNDGVWPDSSDPGPWLNRPMRSELGLPAPEEAIGRKAFDFTSFLSGGQVIMTRAKKVNGVPSVPSRWLMRINALLNGLGIPDALDCETPWLAWSRARDCHGKRVSIKPPQPKPPIDLRPRALSVSSVERLIANPYAIFAAKILKLEPIPELGAPPDAALRGAIIHAVLARFASAYPKTLPVDVLGALTSFARDVLTEYTGHPRVAAFWLPRFERFASWFAQTEPSRRVELIKTLAEVSGSLEFESAAGPFKLTARADRIDITGSGLVITDYKTGRMPSDKAVLGGISPQLPLEAAIAQEGGFGSNVSTELNALCYICASGAEPPGEQHTVKTPDISGLAGQTLDNLKALIAKFDDKDTAYVCLRSQHFSYDYDDFAHLARVAEWSSHGQDGQDGGE